MKKDLTELVFILDRSGSMQGLEGDTIGGFNAMIEKQKKEPGEAFVSTVLFDDQTEVLHDRVKVSDVKPITEKEYYVRGCTALLDAVGGAGGIPAHAGGMGPQGQAQPGEGGAQIPGAHHQHLGVQQGAGPAQILPPGLHLLIPVLGQALHEGEQHGKQVLRHRVAVGPGGAGQQNPLRQDAGGGVPYGRRSHDAASQGP